jgi:hypothetical protein
MLLSGGLPYGFHHLDMPEIHYDGYPVFFDVNLQQSRAYDLSTYMRDGGYIDELTAFVTVSLLVYNAELGLFALAEVHMNFATPTGLQEVSTYFQVFKVTLYETTQDYIRLVLEFILTAIVIHYIYDEFVDMRENGLRVYFTTFSSYVDIAQMSLQVKVISGYIYYYFVLVPLFKPLTKFDVYHDLDAPARFLRLKDDSGDGLGSVVSMFRSARRMADWNTDIISVSTLTLILMTCRIIQLLNFQPRIGLATRTMAVAAKDLAHFMVLFMLVLTGFALIAHLSFGGCVKGFTTLPLAFDRCSLLPPPPSIDLSAILSHPNYPLSYPPSPLPPALSSLPPSLPPSLSPSLPLSLPSLFRMLTAGDFSTYDAIMQSPNWLEGAIFFYAFMLIVFFVLLNILLAIIVDAYAAVKEDTPAGATSMPKEVAKLIRTEARSFDATNPLRQCFFKTKPKRKEKLPLKRMVSQLRTKKIQPSNKQLLKECQELLAIVEFDEQERRENESAVNSQDRQSPPDSMPPRNTRSLDQEGGRMSSENEMEEDRKDQSSTDQSSGQDTEKREPRACLTELGDEAIAAVLDDGALERAALAFADSRHAGDLVRVLQTVRSRFGGRNTAGDDAGVFDVQGTPAATLMYTADAV